MQYGTRFFYTVAYGRVRAQAQSRVYLFIGKKSYGISKFWAFMMSCTIHYYLERGNGRRRHGGGGLRKERGKQ